MTQRAEACLRPGRRWLTSLRSALARAMRAPRAGSWWLPLIQAVRSAVGPLDRAFKASPHFARSPAGRQKVYGIDIDYNAAIDPSSLDLTTFAAGVVPVARGSSLGMPESLDKNASTQTPAPRAVATIYKLPDIYGFVGVPLADLRVRPCAYWTTGQTVVRIRRSVWAWKDRR